MAFEQTMVPPECKMHLTRMFGPWKTYWPTIVTALTEINILKCARCPARTILFRLTWDKYTFDFCGVCRYSIASSWRLRKEFEESLDAEHP
jgi:hypothetical protein